MDKKNVAKNVLTHPCLVAIYLGLICMVTQVKLPAVITATVKYLGDCNSALTMLIVGRILADVIITLIQTLFIRRLIKIQTCFLYSV